MERREMTNAEVEQLKALLGPDKVLETFSEDYAHDELSGTSGMPCVLTRPTETGDVAKVMRFASEKCIPIVVRGSGTGLVGGAVAVCGGILLETTAMNSILELDENNLTITAEPGVLLMDLAAYCEERGFMYPPDPGEKSATIGGNISTNAGGMRAVKYGVTRDFVLGLEIVLPSGEVISLGGKVVKNSSGYSLKDLIIGSEGTLAVITRATLKLIPKPTASLSMLVPFGDIETAIDAVSAIIRSNADCTAIESLGH